MYLCGRQNRDRLISHFSSNIFLEKEAGKGKLMHMTGILDIGEKFRLKDLLQNYINLGMPVEVYSGATKESRARFEARFPTIRIGPRQEAVFQKDTGMLLADVSVQAMLELSEKKRCNSAFR